MSCVPDEQEIKAEHQRTAGDPDNLRHFMYGRYGVDSLGRFLIGVMFVLIVLSFFIRGWIPQVLIWALLFYSYFRMFSRNIPKRYAENQKYLSVSGSVRKFFRIRKKRFDDRGTYRHFTCPKCGQDLRVPKGKGKVRITCPKCRTSFEKEV